MGVAVKRSQSERWLPSVARTGQKFDVNFPELTSSRSVTSSRQYSTWATLFAYLFVHLLVESFLFCLCYIVFLKFFAWCLDGVSKLRNSTQKLIDGTDVCLSYYTMNDELADIYIRFLNSQYYFLSNVYIYIVDYVSMGSAVSASIAAICLFKSGNHWLIIRTISGLF